MPMGRQLSFPLSGVIGRITLTSGESSILYEVFMRRFVICFIIMMLSSYAALAAPVTTVTPSHRQAAQELLQVTDMPRQFDSAIREMMAVQFQAMPEMELFKPAIEKWLATTITWKQVEPEMITLYTEEFSEKELKDLTSFYRTPTGRKAMERLPVIMRRGGEIGLRLAQAHEDELKRLITERAEELQRQGKLPK
jgi:hypothetical protein